MTDQSKPTTDMPDLPDVIFIANAIHQTVGNFKQVYGVYTTHVVDPAPDRKHIQTKYIRADLVPAAPTGYKAAAMEWHRTGNLLYTLKHHSWRKGVEQLTNATTVEVKGDNAEETIQLILKSLQENTAPDDSDLVKALLLDALPKPGTANFKCYGVKNQVEEAYSAFAAHNTKTQGAV